MGQIPQELLVPKAETHDEGDVAFRQRTDAYRVPAEHPLSLRTVVPLAAHRPNDETVC